MTSNRWLLACICVVIAGSFLAGFWPLAALGVVGMGFVGRGLFAVVLGLLLDLAYGAPVGLAAYMLFPFTILGLTVVVVRFWSARYFMNRSSPEHL